MTNREAFVTALAVLGATFDRKLSAPAVEGYWLALSDLTEDDFKAAMKRALIECKFMPSPGELLAFAGKKKDPGVDSVLAWQAVRKAIDKYDYLVATIDFGPLVNAVIRNLGGWNTLCRATLPELDNPGWLRKRFDEIYRTLSSADPTTLHGDALDGALPPKWDEPRHVIVPLDGKPPLIRLEANGASDHRASIAAHIEQLADGKTIE
jgi:hypothetical protein